MNKINSITSLVFFICVFLFVGLGCKQLDSLTSKDEPAPPIPRDTDTGKSNTPGKSNLSSDVSGKYSATGTNVNGGGNYTADLIVTKREDVYQFSWDSKGNKYEGVGVQIAEKVAVSFADGADGKGCGVILYKINSDGSLNGKTGIGDQTI